MGHWNYRIVRVDGYCHIREIYYDDKGEIWLWTQSPAAPVGENADEVRSDLQLMLKACEAPILELVDNHFVEVGDEHRIQGEEN